MLPLDATPWGRLITIALIVGSLLVVFHLLNKWSRLRAVAVTPNSDIVICRPALGWAFLTLLLGAGMLSGAVYSGFRSIHFGDLQGQAIGLLVALVAAIEGVYFVLAVLRYRVILRPDSITLKGIFIDRSLTRQEIAGSRIIIVNAASYVRLYPKPDLHKRPIKIAFWYDRDVEIGTWVSGLPTLPIGSEPFDRTTIRIAAVVVGAILFTAFGIFFSHRSDGFADLGLPSNTRASLEALQRESSGVKTVQQKALDVRAAIEEGDYSRARNLYTQVADDSRLQYWRFYPFEDFIATVSDLTDPRFVSRLDGWVAQSPRDSVPLLLRAQFETDSAWYTRGHNYSAQTRSDHLAAFARDMAKARADVQASLRLDDHNPYAFYLTLRILQSDGPTQSLQQAFEQAIAKYPGYYPLYDIVLRTLAPKWGGSIPQMYRFVDRYAGRAPTNSPLRLLYVSLYRDLLDTAASGCSSDWSSGRVKYTQCLTSAAQLAIGPQLGPQVRETLQLYNTTDKYQFGLALKDILFDMLKTIGAEAYSGAVLEAAAAVMHSDTRLDEKKGIHNNYVIDEAAAESWYIQGFYDNAFKKETEALSDVEAAAFPSKQEKAQAAAEILDNFAAIDNKLSRWSEMVAYERGAVALGMWIPQQSFLCYGYYELARHAEAVSACSKSMEVHTDNLQARYWRGMVYRDSGNFESARRDFTVVAESESNYRVSAAIELSMIYFKHNDYANALKMLNRYTYLYDPNIDDNTDIAVSYNNRCYAYMQLGQLKNALADCTASLKYGSIPDAIRKESELLRRLKRSGPQI